MTEYITDIEMSSLFAQNPSTKSDGGFQSLIVRLQNKTDRANKLITLSDKDIADIIRYCNNYGNGGWEKILRGTFGRILSL